MIEFVNTYIFGPGLCVSVFVFGIFLVFYLNGFFILKPGRMLSALNSGGGDGMSPLKAMIVALAGTLGVGNIVGVASAVSVGGAGAVFWMLVSVIAALPLKYAEILLAVRHRRRCGDGKYRGGAYFYIYDRGGKTASFAAGLFAVLCVAASFTMGSAVQVNAAAVSMEECFGVPRLLVGLLFALATLAVASGGLDRIAFMTGRLVPLMSAVYIAMSAFIIVTNLDAAWAAVVSIVTNAFSKEAFAGGVIGFITSRAVRLGVTRGIVSNEAGCGTAPIAHAGADVKLPAVQGVWGIAEVVIDTAVICTLTAFSVLIAESHGVKLTSDGMLTAALSYSRFIPFASPILAVSVPVFAFCTVICWFYYGSESLSYLVKGRGGRILCSAYLCVYSISAAAGAVFDGEWLWSLADLVISAMTALNICFLMLSLKEIKEETDNYFFVKTKEKKNK